MGRFARSPIGRTHRHERLTRSFTSATGCATVLGFLFGRLKHAEVARADSAGDDNAFRRQAAFQELSNRGGSARHSFVEAPIIERRQLGVREHDL
jgi:myo-inositol catabolism protein IolC